MKKLTLATLPLLAVVVLVASGCGGDTATQLEGRRPQARRTDLPGLVEGRLATAREQDPCRCLLPGLGAVAAQREDQRQRDLRRRRRPVRLGLEGQELPRQHGLARVGERRGARQFPRLPRPDEGADLRLGGLQRRQADEAERPVLLGRARESLASAVSRQPSTPSTRTPTSGTSSTPGTTAAASTRSASTSPSRSPTPWCQEPAPHAAQPRARPAGRLMRLTRKQLVAGAGAGARCRRDLRARRPPGAAARARGRRARAAAARAAPPRRASASSTTTASRCSSRRSTTSS